MLVIYCERHYRAALTCGARGHRGLFPCRKYTVSYQFLTAPSVQVAGGTSSDGLTYCATPAEMGVVVGAAG